MEIVMTHEPTIKWCADTFGGKCIPKPRKEYKMQYRWRQGFRDAYEIAKAIEPYAVTKKTELQNKIKQMSKFSSNVKIVSTAKSTDDSTRMLELYSKKGKNNLISFAMGDFGRISRILCLYLGSPYTYVSLGKAVAPGQFSIDEVKKITNLKK